MKEKTVYICSECGFESPKWLGKCPGCGNWSTLEESIVNKPLKAAKGASGPSSGARASEPVRIASLKSESDERHKTGISEFDRVLGGGLVTGSVVLVGGDPGIGKSTILMQICFNICSDRRVLYITGEESLAQIRMRAERLAGEKVSDYDNLFVDAKTDISDVLESISRVKPDVVVIDSIQTMYRSDISGAPGGVSQVRECALALINRAKSEGISVFLVGHVTKEGSLAGPRVLEHMVDCVLYFEGEQRHNHRVLRAVKNRYGSTNEIGVFEMGEKGLTEVKNPSMLTLSGRPENAAGAAITCAMEGSRPILSEVQALATQTSFAVPRRMCTGFDYNRAALIIAVLEKHAGVSLNNRDVYINVVGGIRLLEPAADMAVALAIASSVKNTPLGDDLIVFGEIGLSGEIRAVNAISQRISEGVKLGFKRFIVPYQNKLPDASAFGDAEIYKARTIAQALALTLR
ncbi:MAG: DNA repair protein RadA [Clostridia bacterium]|nr:DNA repair protein RadA [Clostridia bacterium]